MSEIIHFAPGISCIDDIELVHGPIVDSTSLQKLADCPRYYETRVVKGLDPAGPPSAKMVAGIAIHEALEYFYSLTPEVRATREAQELAITTALTSWESFSIDRGLMDPDSTHLSEDNIARILEAYFHYWQHEAIDIYEPIHLTLDDLDLSDVLAARFKTNDDGALILGESNLIMRFPLPDGTLVFAGKPDLPVRDQLGRVYIMDHKTTSSYLSDWWAKQFQVSNKMRIYMAMIRSLLSETPAGAIINGIYVGKHATNPNSKATKFTRYTYDFTPDHIDEAVANWHAWKKVAEHYASTGYYPQGCAFGGCSMPDLCRRDPATREEVIATDYAPSTRNFWTL